MRSRRHEHAVTGIDRMIRNVETGRFERSLSALTAAGALVTAAEIYFEHDSASFGNKMMWVPVVLGPVGAAAGVAGFCSQRLAKTALPLASAAIVANGVQGTYLHARGIAAEARRLVQRPLQPGDGPAAARPAAGHHGRRDGPAGRHPAAGAVSAAAGPAGARPWERTRFPGFDATAQAPHWDAATAGVVLARTGAAARTSGSSPRRRRPSRPALCDQLLGQADEPLVPLAAMIDARLAEAADRRLALRGPARGRPGLAGHAGLPGRRRPRQVRPRLRGVPGGRAAGRHPGRPGPRVRASGTA